MHSRRKPSREHREPAEERYNEEDFAPDPLIAAILARPEYRKQYQRMQEEERRRQEEEEWRRLETKGWRRNEAELWQQQGKADWLRLGDELRRQRDERQLQSQEQRRKHREQQRFKKQSATTQLETPRPAGVPNASVSPDVNLPVIQPHVIQSIVAQPEVRSEHEEKDKTQCQEEKWQRIGEGLRRDIQRYYAHQQRSIRDKTPHLSIDGTMTKLLLELQELTVAIISDANSMLNQNEMLLQEICAEIKEKFNRLCDQIREAEAQHLREKDVPVQHCKAVAHLDPTQPTALQIDDNASAQLDATQSEETALQIDDDVSAPDAVDQQDATQSEEIQLDVVHRDYAVQSTSNHYVPVQPKEIDKPATDRAITIKDTPGQDAVLHSDTAQLAIIQNKAYEETVVIESNYVQSSAMIAKLRNSNLFKIGGDPQHATVKGKFSRRRWDKGKKRRRTPFTLDDDTAKPKWKMKRKERQDLLESLPKRAKSCNEDDFWNYEELGNRFDFCSYFPT